MGDLIDISICSDCIEDWENIQQTMQQNTQQQNTQQQNTQQQNTQQQSAQQQNTQQQNTQQDMQQIEDDLVKSNKLRRPLVDGFVYKPAQIIKKTFGLDEPERLGVDIEITGGCMQQIQKGCQIEEDDGTGSEDNGSESEEDGWNMRVGGCAKQIAGGGVWQEGQLSAQISNYYDKVNSKKFFAGLYFDPLFQGNAGRYINAKLPGLLDSDNTRTVLVKEFSPKVRNFLETRNQPTDSTEREPIHLDDYVRAITNGRGGRESIGNYFPRDGMAVSFTRRGHFLYPIGQALAGLWQSPFQNSANESEYPGGPGGITWTIFRFHQSPTSEATIIANDDDCRNVEFKSFLVKVLTNSTEKWLTVPDISGTKKVVLTDQPLTYFTFGQFSNQKML